MSSLADMRNAQALATARNQQEFSADQEFFSVAGNIGIVDSGTKLLKKGPDGEALGLQMLFEKTGEGKDAKYVHGDIAVNALNEVGLVKLFKDVEGDTIKEGKVSGINDNGDGSFSIMIDTPQGFFPKTFGFSNDPNDKVIKMDKAQVEKFVNLGLILLLIQALQKEQLTPNRTDLSYPAQDNLLWKMDNLVHPNLSLVT